MRRELNDALWQAAQLWLPFILPGHLGSCSSTKL